MAAARSISRNILCLALFSGLTLAGVAQAQNQTQSQSSQSGEARGIELIEVIGYRDSLRKNLAIKRESDTIVDAISAEDVGQFPDLNIADALQRVTGVQVEKDERDGEGVRISIRGTPSHLNLAFLNNQQVASATASNRRTELRDRSFNYYLLPTEILDTVEVFKTPEANIDEGSMGGTVIVRTRRPLEAEANSGAVQARYFNFDNAGENKPYLSGLYSWKNEDETFGF
ncbi:MAG: TonB-dependent receptor plug domain-containing protein, partial [Gammaproteobacteria bacterium]|nr:TonB-dependent receptor plug domain-containing protein [Gammaproteobacteria bacterium]